MNTNHIYQLYYAKNICCLKTEVYKLHSMFLYFKDLPEFIFHLIRIVRGKYFPYSILLCFRELSKRVFAFKDLSFRVLFIGLYFHISRSIRSSQDCSSQDFSSINIWHSRQQLVGSGAVCRSLLHQEFVSLNSNLHNANEQQEEQQVSLARSDRASTAL